MFEMLQTHKGNITKWEPTELTWGLPHLHRTQWFHQHKKQHMHGQSVQPDMCGVQGTERYPGQNQGQPHSLWKLDLWETPTLHHCTLHRQTNTSLINLIMLPLLVCLWSSLSFSAASSLFCFSSCLRSLASFLCFWVSFTVFDQRKHGDYTQILILKWEFEWTLTSWCSILDYIVVKPYYYILHQLLTANLALASPILTFSFPFLPIYPFLCLKKWKYLYVKITWEIACCFHLNRF